VVYVLIFLGLAVVIAPLVSAMPTKSQRRKAALRDHARSCELRVSLRPLPAIPARFRCEPEGELACYEHRLASALQVPNRRDQFVRAQGDWFPTVGVLQAPSWLAELPEGALYVEWLEKTVSIFWDEKEDLDGLIKIKQAIDLIQ